MKNLKIKEDISIYEIEELTEEQIKEVAIENILINDHMCYFVELGKYFEYSVVVFRNSRQIRHANDYQLHHRNLAEEKGKDALRDYYITKMNKILFTDAQLMEDVKDYHDYQLKEHFIRNYLPMMYEYYSIWGDKANEMKEKGFNRFSSIAFGYFDNNEYIERSKKLLKHVEDSYNKIRMQKEEFRKSVLYELYNHEAGITYSWDDALYSMGMSFDELDEMHQSIVRDALDEVIKNTIY